MDCKSCRHWDNGYCYRYPHPIRTTHICGEYAGKGSKSDDELINVAASIQTPTGNKNALEGLKSKPKRKRGK